LSTFLEGEYNARHKPIIIIVILRDCIRYLSVYLAAGMSEHFNQIMIVHILIELRIIIQNADDLKKQLILEKLFAAIILIFSCASLEINDGEKIVRRKK
jgi:hypothetical protein